MTWKRNYFKSNVGKEVGGFRKGYKFFKLFDKNYSVHRVAWLLFYGQWPKNIIDHINHNRADNRIVNIRDATYGENQLNQKENRPSKSGKPGIYPTGYRTYSVFKLGKTKTGNNNYLGTRHSLEDALKLQSAE